MSVVCCVNLTFSCLKKNADSRRQIETQRPFYSHGIIDNNRHPELEGWNRNPWWSSLSSILPSSFSSLLISYSLLHILQPSFFTNPFLIFPPKLSFLSAFSAFVIDKRTRILFSSSASILSLQFLVFLFHSPQFLVPNSSSSIHCSSFIIPNS